MPEYSREDERYARRVVEQCLERDAEGLEIEPTLAIADVESDARDFAEDLKILGQLGVNMPAVSMGNDLVPIALEYVVGWSRPSIFGLRFGVREPWYRGPYSQEALYEALREYFQSQIVDRFSSMDRQEARQTFLRRATDFLATRMAAVRRFRSHGPEQAWPGASFLNFPQILRGPSVMTPGCNFTVTTNSTGLRVFWSGPYRLNSNYFNHPTTPTSSVLQSGTYIFGVDGGAYANNIQWDFNAVVSLPGQPHLHLNF